MEVDSPRFRSQGVGGSRDVGRGVLNDFHLRVRPEVTFSEGSMADYKSVDYYGIPDRQSFTSRDYGESKAYRLQKVRAGTKSTMDPASRLTNVDYRGTPYRLPRIVVKDTFGRKLDTFTALQEAIYRAKWNVRNTLESHTAREWRLPKAPLPSRPDYSRQTAQFSKRGIDPRGLPGVSKRNPVGSVVEIGVEDVSYVAESLRHLPKLETFSDVFRALSCGHEKVYLHIVARLLLHEKMLSSEDKREALYEFPGFCTGCRRAGFCYACRRGGGNFHVHHDRQARTGGGYTYWKRDCPQDPDDSKHPSCWGLRIPEHQLRLLLESGNTLSDAAKQALRKRLMSQYPWLQAMLEDDVSLDRMKEKGLVLTVEEMAEAAVEENALEADRYEEYPDLTYLTQQEKFRQTREETKKKYTFKLKRSSVARTSAPETSVDTGISSERQDTEKRLRRGDEGRVGGWDSDSVYDTSFIGGSDRDDEDEENTDTERKKPSLYRAPKFFKLKKRQRKTTVSRSPFSDNRQYDLPTGRSFDTKKSDRSTTKFVEFNRSAHGWKEPKKFEIVQNDRKPTKFWQPKTEDGSKGKRRIQKNEDQVDNFRSAMDRKRQELERSLSPDSGLDSEHVNESVKESTFDMYQDGTSIPFTETDYEHTSLVNDQQDDSGKEASESESPCEHLSPHPNIKEKRSAIVKKARSPIQVRKPKTPVMTPELPAEEPVVDTVSPEPPSREMTPPAPPALPTEPYRPDISLPDLPAYQKAKREEKKGKVQKFFVEAPPPVKTPPKKRKSPPKVRKLPKMQYRRKSKPAEAPVTTEALQDVGDPLDFLAKYCIINPNRLPFYEIIFENMVGDQTPRYQKPASVPDQSLHSEREVTEVKGKGKKSAKKSNDEISEHELKLARDMLLINHGHHLITDKLGLSQAEEYREKVVYTLDTLHTKSIMMKKLLTELDIRRLSALAEGTRQQFPDVCAHDYVPPDKKKGKKGKKSKKNKDTEPFTPRRRGEPVPDVVIVDRLTDSQLNTLSEEGDVRQLNLERERTEEKILNVHQRIQQLEGEKLLLDILCSESYFADQLDNQHPASFRRQQSQLYNKLHPDPDYELDFELFEEALQQVNNHLLTEQEFKYIYFILDLPGRSKINFRLFSVIAALSEKVTQLDPVIRDLLNKFDYNALDVKMDKCKDLFHLLEDDQLTSPNGGAPASNLALELAAGGLTPEHINYVLSKFNREGKGSFDFMDFVTYIPLFIEIHQRIIKDPLSEEQDL